MEDIRLKYIDIKEFKEEVYRHYVEIFPEVERKSLALIKSSYERKYANIIKILNKNEFVGFMILNSITEKGYLIIDYLAILPKYRNNNFGTKALKILIEEKKENKGIFIEIEKVGLGKDKEENLLREKRRKFYENLGFKELNYDFDLFNNIYTPYLFSNTNEDEEVVVQEIVKIYEEITGKERTRKNCKIIKN